MTARVLLLAVLLAAAPWAAHAENGAGGSPAADELTGLVATARRMNPDVQVAVLEADAAAAKVQGADSLPDPKLQWQVLQWPTVNGGALPRSPFLGDSMVTLSQMFPLWGKRDLRRDIAVAGARQARLMRQEVENEVVARVEIAYAQFHSAYLVVDLDRGLRGRMDTLAKLAVARYAQGLGKQEDATRAEVEKTRLEAEIARTEAEREQARLAINRLLARDLDTPLAERPKPRTIPSAGALELSALSARAQAANPQILAEQASSEGADKEASLAGKEWYPDVEVGLGPETMGGRWVGYNMMVSTTLPLQWGLHDSQVGEAKAKAAAARSKSEAVSRDVDKELGDAWVGLNSSRQVEALLRDSQLPQAKIGFDSVANGYALGRTSFVDVLTAEQQLWQTDIELIRVQFEQQERLAEIEKLVGGKL